MPNPKNYLFNLPSTGRPHDIHIPEVWYPGVKEHWNKSTSSRIYDAILGVRAVVIHATAGFSSSGAMSVMKQHKASWHWLVPDEDEPEHNNLIWACAPEARAAWHVRNAVSNSKLYEGKNRVNHWSLGIEIVNSQPPGSDDSYSEWQVDITAQIVRYCWAKYPNLKHIVSHALLDPSRRTDPGTQFPWSDFKEKVHDGSGNMAFENFVDNATPLSQISENVPDDACCMTS